MSNKLGKLAAAVAIACCAAAALPALAATEAEKLAAINNGLTWLAGQQAADGRWSSGYGASGDVAATGAVMLSFMEQGYVPNAAAAAGSYEKRLADGLNWIWQNGVRQKALTLQGVNNPDTNGNGIGYKFNTVAGSSSYDMYNTGIVLPALVKAGAASTVINSPGSVVHGMTYGQLTQDVVDYLAWGQTDSGFGRGGWRYGESSGASQQGSDNSVAQWPALGMLYAQGAGATVPQFVKDEMKFWLQYSQNDTTGGAGYTDPNGTTALRTGSWLVQAMLAGNLSAAERQAALNYIDAHWTNDGSIFGDLYGMWAVYKGLDTYIGIDNMSEITLNLHANPGDLDNPNHGYNWWEDMNEWLVTHQDAAGSFTISGGYTNSIMRTAYGVNILQAVQIGPGPDQIPEPATLALLAIGLAGLGWTTRRRSAGA